MKTNQCLYCYQKLSEEELNSPAGRMGYHKACSKKLFGLDTPPEFNCSDDNLMQLPQEVLNTQKTVTGAQAKLFLGLQKGTAANPSKLTIVGLWGEYILEPQSQDYSQLPELEDLSMHLAHLAGIATVPHGLFRLPSGSLAYITKRVDRLKSEKLHMEDMCQLSERLTEHKYKGSYEQIAKLILKHSAYPVFDVISFYEQVLFSFLTGNSDMHLKNFSLLKDKKEGYKLCPAYDMVAAALVVEGDDEELALNLNGKKKKLKRADFETAMRTARIDDKSIQNIFQKFEKMKSKWMEFIDLSFLSDDLKLAYNELLEKRYVQLEL